MFSPLKSVKLMFFQQRNQHIARRAAVGVVGVMRLDGVTLCDGLINDPMIRVRL